MTAIGTNFQFTTSAVTVHLLSKGAKAEVSSEFTMQKLGNKDSLSVFKISLSSKSERLHSIFFWKNAVKTNKNIVY
jgi:hypothetical protein